MRLSDHLRAASGQPDDEGNAGDVTTAPAPADPLAGLKARARDALLSRLGTRLYDASLSPAQLNQNVIDELGKVLDEETVPLTATEREQLVSEISDDVLGFGPIERFLADPTVTEVMVNGSHSIYVERGGRLYRTDEHFDSDARVRQVIDKIVSAVGRRVDESSPMVDARLADGSRVNAVIPPLAIDGPTLTIRKFAKHRLSVEDLNDFGTLTPEATEFLSACVMGRLNILISGGTGTGKTTLLNVLSSLIPEDERIVTIEDAAELQLDQDHLIRLESRPVNLEGRGGVTIRDLVRNALRMRPDRIIVGEVRGAETLDMLQAMNTGHDGSLSTLHANSPRDALFRLETMTLMAGVDLPLRAIRDQIASALDLVVHISRLRDGSRRVTQITEVCGAEGEVVSLSDLFGFDYAAGLDDEGHHRGRLAPTGLRPGFAERLRDSGIELPARLLGIEASSLARPGTRR
ncbi:MAG: CpaF family protein [Acidimicrobiia bacterium]